MKYFNLSILGLLLVTLSGLVMAGPSFQFGKQGFVQFEYALQVWSQYRSYRSINHDGAGNDIYLRRNRITISGQQSDIVGFFMQFDAADDGRQGNAEKPVYYRDAYITMDFKDSLRFIVGRFKPPFSRENLEACLEPLTLDRSLESYTPFRGTRDAGAAIWGNLDNALFQYRFMVSDGREGDHVPKKTPRLTGRFHVSLLDPEFGYGYEGTYLGTRRVLTFGVGYDYQGNVTYSNYQTKTGTDDYNAWTVDGFFEYPFASGTYTLSSAYFNYDVSKAIDKAHPDPQLPYNTQLEAWYVKGGYLYPSRVGPGRIQVFARYDHNNYHLGGPLDNESTGVGANYYINGQKLKLTAAYKQVSFDVPQTGNPSLKDYHQFTAGFQFIL